MWPVKKRAKLSETQIKELAAFIRNSSSDAIEVRRAQTILMINDEMSLTTIESLTGYSKRHTFQLRKNYLAEGLERIKTKKPELKKLLTRGQRESVGKMLHEDTPQKFGFESEFWTTPILAMVIREQFGVQYKSKTSLYIIFKDAKFSFHKPGAKYDRRDQQKIDQWKEEIRPFVEEAKNDPNTVILAEDEMMLTTQTTFQKIWLPQGEFPRIDVSTKRKLRCIYGYLNLQSKVEHAFKALGGNSQETIATLEHIGNYYKGKKIVLFWDNAKYHKSEEMKEFLRTTKHNFVLKNFPPYSPELNPQEHVWKAGRARITHNNFIENIDKAADEFVTYLNSTLFQYKFL